MGHILFHCLRNFAVLRPNIICDGISRVSKEQETLNLDRTSMLSSSDNEIFSIRKGGSIASFTLSSRERQGGKADRGVPYGEHPSHLRPFAEPIRKSSEPEHAAERRWNRPLPIENIFCLPVL